MISARLNTKTFMKDMKNILNYSYGFLEGAEKGKPEMLTKMGVTIKELALQYIDTMARVEPQKLQHVYEWYQAGSSSARLFEISCTVSSAGMTFFSTMSQSKTIASGAKEPFYNKAKIMESGNPITIKPKRAKNLVFETESGTVFTKNPVTIHHPGGQDAQGGLEDTLRTFFMQYLTQSILTSSGLLRHLSIPKEYSKYLKSGKLNGRTAGISAGHKWVVNVGGIIE